MCNNFYLQEKMLEEMQRNRTLEIERRHIVAQATGNTHGVRHIIGRFGTCIVRFGMCLERIERHNIPVQA